MYCTLRGAQSDQAAEISQLIAMSLFQSRATQRVPRGGHRNTAAGEPDGVRHRLAGCLVRPVPTQLRSCADT